MDGLWAEAFKWAHPQQKSEKVFAPAVSFAKTVARCSRLAVSIFSNDVNIW